jgi:hypothetical protein
LKNGINEGLRREDEGGRMEYWGDGRLKNTTNATNTTNTTKECQKSNIK